MVHSAPPPPVPRLPNPSDGPLHLLAGVPEGGVPAAPADRLVPLPPHPGPPPPPPTWHLVMLGPPQHMQLSGMLIWC